MYLLIFSWNVDWNRSDIVTHTYIIYMYIGFKNYIFFGQSSIVVDSLHLYNLYRNNTFISSKAEKEQARMLIWAPWLSQVKAMISRTLIILEYRDNIALCIALSEPRLFTGKHAINFYLCIYIYICQPLLTNFKIHIYVKMINELWARHIYVYEVINSSDGKRTY